MKGDPAAPGDTPGEPAAPGEATASAEAAAPCAPPIVYRRLATAGGSPPVNGQTAFIPTPWDVIESAAALCSSGSSAGSPPADRSLTSARDPLSYGPPAATTDSEPSGDDSDFSLTDAWTEARELDQCREHLVEFKPINELRDLLLAARVPTAHVVEILKSLQIRDNWLSFLSKHFRRSLRSLENQRAGRDLRLGELRELLSDVLSPERASPPGERPSGPSSPKATSGPSSPKATLPAPSSPKPPPPRNPSPKSLPPRAPSPAVDQPRFSPRVQPKDVERKAPVAKKADMSRLLDNVHCKMLQGKGGKRRVEAAVTRVSWPAACAGSSWPVVFTVVTARGARLSQRPLAVPPCISLVAARLGTAPTEHSGLSHFSQTCVQRAAKVSG